MKQNKAEVCDFKCRSCGTTWLNYIENKKLCNNSIVHDGIHNFDFGTPIRLNVQEADDSKSDDEIHDTNAIFVTCVYSILELRQDA